MKNSVFMVRVSRSPSPRRASCGCVYDTGDLTFCELHSAANALLAALTAMMVRFEQTGEAWMQDPAMVQARAAIALAEGQP